jgi:protein gp37
MLTTLKANPITDKGFDETVLKRIRELKTPTKIHLCTQCDLFDDHIEIDWIKKILKTCALCPQHKFQIVTRNPENLKFVDFSGLNNVEISIYPKNT